MYTHTTNMIAIFLDTKLAVTEHSSCCITLEYPFQNLEPHKVWASVQLGALLASLLLMAFIDDVLPRYQRYGTGGIFHDFFVHQPRDDELFIFVTD